MLVKSYNIDRIKLRWPIKILIILGAIFLSWRLLRFADQTYILWQFHLYVLGFLLLISLPYLMRYIYSVSDNMSHYIMAFLLSGLLSQVIFPGIDTFSVAMSTFLLYFLFERKFSKIDAYRFFRGFRLLLFLMLVLNFIDLMNHHFLDHRLFNYERAAEIFRDINLAGYISKPLLPGIIDLHGRPPGVSGTPYATSALIAAIAIYFYIARNSFLFILSVLTLILWATGSSIIIFVMVFLFLNIRKWYSPLIVLLGIAGVIGLIEARGFSSASYFKIIQEFSPLQLLAALIIGEGRHVSSMFSEFRIVGLFFSLGVLGVSFLVAMIMRYWKITKQKQKTMEYMYYRAGFWFILTLLMTNWHYQTVFIFPNIIFVVMLLAFVSSRNSCEQNQSARLYGRKRVTLEAI